MGQCLNSESLVSVCTAYIINSLYGLYNKQFVRLVYIVYINTGVYPLLIVIV